MLRIDSRVLYLHGFASGPASRKATFFAGKLRSLGFEVEVPDLAEGDFENLTLTRQIKIIERLANGEGVTLIGSSMGGYLAALYAARHPEVQRLILLAPAFAFHELWAAQMTPNEIARWRENGTVNVFHYGTGREMPLHYHLFDDAALYEPYPAITQPAIIFHGEHDRSVPIDYSLRFVATHPKAKLVRLQSGHELTDVLDPIWSESKSFLESQISGHEC